MFGEKLKKLRTDNQLTQDELAERIYVTRTAISKWETNKGYPSIDSLKQLSTLFGISIDELISDDDVENQRLLEQKQSRRCYWCAIGCLTAAVGAALIDYFAAMPNMRFVGLIAVIGYVSFGVLSKPRYKRMELKKLVAPYVLSRLVILAVVIVAMVTAFTRQ